MKKVRFELKYYILNFNILYNLFCFIKYFIYICNINKKNIYYFKYF